MKKGVVAVEVSFRFGSEAEFRDSRPLEHEIFCNAIGGLFDEYRTLHDACPFGSGPVALQGEIASAPGKGPSGGAVAAPAGGAVSEASGARGA